ncbi:MAG: polysaccharide ABC transporter ATP-binding protein, partial [Lewinella sp.]|uniref:ABC transporter ATP-binding protein n=1 Tax=Lewinella sp. TaxID=2004506 RepID=UPI003D6AD688
FDEIVAFSGVENFLDLPVKRYSSGMYVRLGFAIAAHLEAEVLLVDEVLAVGDAEFQKKCLGKIGDVAQSGRTVFFVSHNLNSIQQLCTEALIIKEGKLDAVKAVREGVAKYLNSIEEKNQETKVYFNISEFRTTVVLNGSNPVSVNLVIGLQNLCLNGDIFLGFVFRTLQGESVFGVNNEHYYQSLHNTVRTSCVIAVEIPELPLVSGRYILDIYFNDKKNDLKEIWYNAGYIDVPTIDGVNFSLINEKINQIVIPNLNWSFLQ